MPDMYEHPYLDANVYLSLVRGSPPEPAGRADLAQSILDDAIKGTYPIIASTFLKAEVLGRETTDQADRIDQFFTNNCFEWVEVDLPISERARDFGRGTPRFRPADAVHMATAIRAGADQLLTWDTNFPKGTFEGVLVTEPHWAGQEKLV